MSLKIEIEMMQKKFSWFLFLFHLEKIELSLKSFEKSPHIK